jgi:hypothetical protein
VSGRLLRSESSLRGAIGASKDARLPTGYGDEAIQRTKGVPRSLDCFASLAMTVATAAYLQAVAGRISSLRRFARKANAP